MPLRDPMWIRDMFVGLIFLDVASPSRMFVEIDVGNRDRPKAKDPILPHTPVVLPT